MTEAVTLFSRLIKSQQNNSETLPNTMPTKLIRGKANKSKEALEKTKEKINEKKDEIGEIELQKNLSTSVNADKDGPSNSKQ